MTVQFMESIEMSGKPPSGSVVQVMESTIDMPLGMAVQVNVKMRTG